MLDPRMAAMMGMSAPGMAAPAPKQKAAPKPKKAAKQKKAKTPKKPKK